MKNKNEYRELITVLSQYKHLPISILISKPSLHMKAKRKKLIKTNKGLELATSFYRPIAKIALND